MHPWLMILAWYGLASAVTFVVYAWDKRRATVGGWRVSERNLQLLALAGGWPGAHAARALLRHKTRKIGFSVVLWLITLLHIAALILVFFRM